MAAGVGVEAMNIFAIDPGNEQSAYVLFDSLTPKILLKGKCYNEEIFPLLLREPIHHAAIEMIASNGMPVGKEVFETCLWVGRYVQRCVDLKIPYELVYRKDEKMVLCQSMRARDSNIRQALIDRFGAPGTKKAPGFTYGVSNDIWQALAVAVTFCEIEGIRIGG